MESQLELKREINVQIGHLQVAYMIEQVIKLLKEKSKEQVIKMINNAIDNFAGNYFYFKMSLLDVRDILSKN